LDVIALLELLLGEKFMFVVGSIDDLELRVGILALEVEDVVHEKSL